MTRTSSSRGLSLSRRDWFGAAALLAVTGAERAARADSARMPVVYLSHGAPLLAVDTERAADFRAWGARLPRPKAILVMTPHYGARHLELGATGRGFAMYDLPGWLKRKLPPDLDYPSPPSEALAARVEALLKDRYPLARGARRGFDHTTWMPLYHLFPGAPAPVLEIAYPFLRERELFELGERLAPLRDEGVLFVASGGMTHNLASIDLGGPPVKPPSWSVEFDAWAEESVRQSAVDALLDWRQRAPAAELAHPDEGGHYRVLLAAAGVALGGQAARFEASFPIVGFEGTLSTRAVQFD